MSGDIRLISRESLSNLSVPFEVTPRGQVQLFASGLEPDDYVEIEMVKIGAAGDGAGTGRVTLPAVIWSAPLRCENGQPVRLTADFPVVVVDYPQRVKLRLRFEGDLSMGDKEVWASDVSFTAVSDRMRGCRCAASAKKGK